MQKENDGSEAALLPRDEVDDMQIEEGEEENQERDFMPRMRVLGESREEDKEAQAAALE